uniref:Putative flagellum transition zone component n=1 Tax=Trypanosoma congolense (strain IL3000) TaxID=1068625 RepID=G0UX46_TRYCI|nr:putative flagellum transition zone component [Trypanosoma congolense IL3000]
MDSVDGTRVILSTSPTPPAAGACAGVVEAWEEKKFLRTDMTEGEVVNPRALFSSPGGFLSVRQAASSAFSPRPNVNENDEFSIDLMCMWERSKAQTKDLSSKHSATSSSIGRRPRCSSSSAATKVAFDVAGPYRDSHSKRFRDRVAGAREASWGDVRLVTLKHENKRYKAELKAKDERLRELEVALRARSERMLRSHCVVTEGTGSGEALPETSSEVERLAKENNELWRRLHQANSQITSWKRDVRVSQLQELKVELALCHSEMVRLTSTRPSSVVSSDVAMALRRQVQQEHETVLKEKDDIITRLKDELSETVTTLRRYMDDATRAQSAADRMQEENELLAKELCMFRKTVLTLADTQEELKRTRDNLAEANERLRQFERVAQMVGGVEGAQALIRERDSLLSLIKELNAREADCRREFIEREREVKENMERCLREAVQQERVFAQDREMQLKHTCLMWKEKYDRMSSLEGTSTRERSVRPPFPKEQHEKQGKVEKLAVARQLPRKVPTPCLKHVEKQLLINKHIDEGLTVCKTSPACALVSSSSAITSSTPLSELSSTQTTQGTSDPGTPSRNSDGGTERSDDHGGSVALQDGEVQGALSSPKFNKSQLNSCRNGDSANATSAAERVLKWDDTHEDIIVDESAEGSPSQPRVNRLLINAPSDEDVVDEVPNLVSTMSTHKLVSDSEALIENQGSLEKQSASVVPVEGVTSKRSEVDPHESPVATLPTAVLPPPVPNTTTMPATFSTLTGSGDPGNPPRVSSAPPIEVSDIMEGDSVPPGNTGPLLSSGSEFSDAPPPAQLTRIHEIAEPDHVTMGRTGVTSDGLRSLQVLLPEAAPETSSDAKGACITSMPAGNVDSSCSSEDPDEALVPPLAPEPSAPSYLLSSASAEMEVSS